WIRSAVEQRELRNRAPRPFDVQHLLSTGGVGAKDAHVPRLYDVETAARFARREQDVSGRHRSHDASLGELPQRIVLELAEQRHASEQRNERSVAWRSVGHAVNKCRRVNRTTTPRLLAAPTVGHAAPPPLAARRAIHEQPAAPLALALPDVIRASGHRQVPGGALWRRTRRIPVPALTALPMRRQLTYRT